MGSRYDAWGSDEDVVPREPSKPIFSSEDILWFIIIVLCGVALLGVHEIRSLHDQLNKLQSTAITCQEDMPCWDCTTMGNKICGPGK